MKFLCAYFNFAFSTVLLAQASMNTTLIGNINYNRFTNDVWGYVDSLGNDYALVGLQDGVSIVKVAADTIYEVDFVPGVNSIWRDLKTHQHYAYVTNESGDGLAIIDLAGLPDSVHFVGNYDDVFTTAHNLYIADGFAYISGSNAAGGADILDLALPQAPVLVGASSFSNFHDIFVLDDRMYASTGSRSSLAIFNITDKSSINLIAEIQIPGNGFSHNAWASLDGNYVMTTEESIDHTVKMWDIHDLSNPELIDEYLSFPSRLAHNTHISGNYAYISHYSDGLRILDISDPEQMVEVGFYDTSPSNATGFDGNWGAFPFTNSGYIYATDESFGLFVIEFNRTRASRLRGRVFESQLGTLIQEATVEAVGLEHASQSDANGKYKLGFAESGAYTIRAYKAGFDTTMFTVDLAEGETILENIFLVAIITNVAESTPGLPETFTLAQNFPNPFNAGTTIRYTLPAQSEVSLTIYNVIGNRVTMLVDEMQSAGEYRIEWDATNATGSAVPSGVYFYRLETGGLVQTNKMILLQ